MSSLKTLLQDADPLRREVPRLDEARERVRLATLGTASAGALLRPARARGRLAPIAAVVVAAGIVALGYGIWSRGMAPVLAAVRLEVRLAENEPVPGLVVARGPGPGSVLYLHPEIVVSNDDIAQSWLVEDGPGNFGVTVRLLPPGAERMRQATANHAGRPIAILIDGAVVMAPIVRAPIGESAEIKGSFTRAEAERIVNGIGNR